MDNDYNGWEDDERRYYEADEIARNQIESGLAHNLREFISMMPERGRPGGHADLLHAIVGPNGEGLDDGWEEYEARQQRRDIYVRKIRLRRPSHRWRPGHEERELGFPGGSPSRNITPDEFAELYSCVAFANRCGIIFNCHLTIRWRSLGIVKHDKVDLEFDRFLSRHRDWCRQRGLPASWIYSHENSPVAGLHTHMMLFMPIGLQNEFRLYIKESFERGYGTNFQEKGQKSVVLRIRAPKSPDKSKRIATLIWVQWLWFQYLCKGINMGARFIITAGPSFKPQVTYLSDLVRFWPQESGAIGCRNRVGSSSNLKAPQREKGYIEPIVFARQPFFKSLMEMMKYDVRQIYSDRYYQAYLRQREITAPGHGIDCKQLPPLEPTVAKARKKAAESQRAGRGRPGLPRKKVLRPRY